MAKGKKVVPISTSTPQIPAGERIYLSPEEIERKSKSQVLDAYVEELGGWVRARLVGADLVIAFLRNSASGDLEKLEAMAQLVYETLCNEDGSDYTTKEQALKFPISTLDNIIGAIAVARKEAKGNV
jgi:hypothetical protein